MIMEYGMSDKLGPMQFGNSQGQVFLGRDLGHEQNYSDAIAYEIDQEMQSIIRTATQGAKELLTEHADKVHLIAETLLERETLDIEQIKQLIEKGKIEDAPKESSDKDDGSGAADGEGSGGAAGGDGTESDGTGGGEGAPEKSESGAADVKVNINPKDREHESNRLDFDKDKGEKEADHRPDAPKPDEPDRSGDTGGEDEKIITERMEDPISEHEADAKASAFLHAHRVSWSGQTGRDGTRSEVQVHFRPRMV